MKKIMCIVLCLLITMAGLSGCMGKSSSVSDFEYEMRDGKMIITAYKGADKEVHIPQEIEGRTVYKIGEGAFEGHNLTSVVLPEGVKYIDDAAFYGCRYLSVVEFPETMHTIGNSAFGRCESLEKVDLPESLSFVDGASFVGTAIQELIIPKETRLEVIGTFLYSPISEETVLVVEEDSEALTAILKYGQGKVNYRIANETSEKTEKGPDFWDRVSQGIEEGKKLFESKTETLYLPTQWVRKNTNGEILSKQTYEYDEHGWVTSWEKDWPSGTEIWDEEMGVFTRTEEPCDGVADLSEAYSYDQYGNLTALRPYRGTSNHYQYSYGDNGKILSYTIIPDTAMMKSETIDLEYKDDGTIEQWKRDASGDSLVCTVEASGGSGDKISKMEFTYVDGDVAFFFEYDEAGNMTEHWFTWNSGDPSGKATCTYDEQGRVTSESGFRNNMKSTYQYQYEDDMLVAVNNEPLEYVKSDNGEIVVLYGDYEVSYMSLKLTEEEASIARYMWNQFCGGFNSNHDKRNRTFGVRYPVFDLNTVLLLPDCFFE